MNMKCSIRTRELNQRALDAMEGIEAGRLEEAEQLFHAILRDSEECDDLGLPETCGQIANLLEKMNRPDEAFSFHERALREAQRFFGTDSLHDGVYRYFFGEYLLRVGRVEAALEQIEPGLNRAPEQDRFLLITYAKCLWRLDRKGDARIAAHARARACDETRTERRRGRAAVRDLGELELRAFVQQLLHELTPTPLPTPPCQLRG